MTPRARSARAASLALLALAPGCVSVAVDPDAGFPGLAAELAARTPERIDWSRGEDAAELTAAIDALLARGLTGDAAVQIALLNNRELQASYAALGMAQAELVQASLLHNPVVGAGALVRGNPVDLAFGLAVDVADLFYAPLRRRTAAADFEGARLLAAGRVLDTAWAARTAFIAHQADEQMLELRRQVADSTAASAEVARRMREAGNLRELDLARERALAGQARLELQAAELAALGSRERLTAILGLWGERTAWALAESRLPEIPSELPAIAGLETRAVARSLDLAAAAQHLVAAQENLRLTRASRFLPEFVAGAGVERDAGRWDAGPSAAIPVPLFDRGQARLARAKLQLVEAQDLHYAIAVQIRSALRDARDRVLAEGERASFYRREQLPLRERVVRESQLQYNAMQLGVFELLRARQEQIETAAGYVETLRAYWLAQADLDLLLAGRLPPPAQGAPGPRIQEAPRFPFPTLQ